MRCGLLVAVVCSVPATALAQTREEAVQAARRGEFDTAISALRTLLTAAPSDTAAAFDLAVVLEWAGRAREATDVFERTGVPDAILDEARGAEHHRHLIVGLVGDASGEAPHRLQAIGLAQALFRRALVLDVGEGPDPLAARAVDSTDGCGA